MTNSVQRFCNGEIQIAPHLSKSVTSIEGALKKVVLAHDMTSQRVELENLVCTGVVLRLYGRNKAVHARVQRYREHHTGVFTVNSPKYDIDTMKAPCTTRTTSKTSSLPLPTCANPSLATPRGMYGLVTYQTCNRSDGGISRIWALKLPQRRPQTFPFATRGIAV